MLLSLLWHFLAKKKRDKMDKVRAYESGFFKVIFILLIEIITFHI